MGNGRKCSATFQGVSATFTAHLNMPSIIFSTRLPLKHQGVQLVDRMLQRQQGGASDVSPLIHFAQNKALNNGHICSQGIGLTRNKRMTLRYLWMHACAYHVLTTCMCLITQHACA